MKKKLLALLAKKEARKAELGTKANATEDIAELRTINTELEAINIEINELRSMIDSIPDEPAPAAASVPAEPSEQRGAAPIGAARVLSTYGVGQGQNGQAAVRTEIEDPYGTLEYRTAFMKFAKTGEITPELRADAMTTVADVSAVIPSTILNEVIRKVTEYGQIFSRVRKLSIKGGVTVPILSLKPTATWIGESPTSDKQKVQANTNISFSYYGLECKVSTSLLADTVTLTGFESTITDLIVEAMVQGLDIAIIKGNGTGKCLGITVDTRVPAGQIVTLSSADFADWSAWKKKVFAKMPLKYKAGASFFMASGTFEGYIDGMVDANGQPIGRINYGITDGPQERFGGKEVILVEDDIVANYDDAAVADVVAVYCNLKNYGLNSNMQMTMFRYFDHDTNEWIDKAILIVDGKLIDPNGVVIVKKGA
ncbi:MAG: phage major capsid protein [Dehalobacter sp.]|nr:phage major capsid protein [Dehalobacter sp.]